MIHHRKGPGFTPRLGAGQERPAGRYTPKTVPLGHGRPEQSPKVKFVLFLLRSCSTGSVGSQTRASRVAGKI